MRLPSTQQDRFARIPRAEIQRSSFDRSHGHKTTFDSGLLVPVFVDEVLPGDTFNLGMTGFVRMTTPLRPVMDNLELCSFFFFVPNRLVWSNFEKFNGEQVNPGDSTDFLVPQVATVAGGFTEKSLMDYFGLPTKQHPIAVNALPFRAYNLIWNEWFRDQNLQTSLTVPTGDGPDTAATFALQRRNKRHDYFSASLPWPQKGASVTIPLGQTAQVIPEASVFPTMALPAGTARNIATTNTSPFPMQMGGSPGGAGNLVWVEPALVADLTTATASSINQLRTAFQVQRLYERDARGGTRYTEIVRSHFGVVSPDARQQRPEYLGGGRSFIHVHQVEQTSASAANNPLGGLGAYATGVMANHGFSKSFSEHGWVIGLVNVRADLTYQQGIERMWSRRTRFDYFWPALAHLGEQAVLSKEIYADGTAGDETVWGYQERYAEYRYKPSRVSGIFRSNAAGTLDSWHLAMSFASRPLLNSTFIPDQPAIARVVAAPTEPQFIGDFHFRFRAARPMPVYGVPGLIDHF